LNQGLQNVTANLVYTNNMKAQHISIFLAALISVAISGCGSKDTVILGADGTKVQTDKAGNATMTGPNGEKLEINADGSMTATDKDGKTTTAKVDKDGKNFSMANEKGESVNISSNAVTEAELGIEFYPGSEEGEGSLKSNAGDTNIVMSVRTTSDDPKKVIEFYKGKIADAKDMTYGSGDEQMATVMGKLGTKDINITAARSKGDPKTKISLAVTEKKSK
jgi:hypothetical protein